MDWMTLKNKSNESADLYFYGDIVSDYWDAWSEGDQYPENVRSLLNEMEGIPHLNIYINSGGGAVFAALAIYNMLKRHPAYKTVHVDGIAASAASLIALVGNKLIMPSNSFLMIHKPLIGVYGNANTFREYADKLDTWEEGILNIYKENLKNPDNFELIKSMVDAETWLTGEQAAQYFNVEVAESNKAVACYSEQFNSYKNTPKNLQKGKTKQDDLNSKIKALKMELELI